ncbi:MAG: 4-hydroxythreonine-4-phosphate dehydrogenase PdxA [Truepera sp.]|nr:4-hydroxythreonine-4-phosphate dehydrogenase PdxA [Truepera sp.]
MIDPSDIPLKAVSAGTTLEAVRVAIKLMRSALEWSGISRPRIAVAALNPHAGEGGLFGREEIEAIRPAIEEARARAIDADGPWPPDTVFRRARSGDYDAVVTMYHDQGQIAMRLMGFERAVTILGGLPLPVTTPAHGTAFDIVGRGVAGRGHRAGLVPCLQARRGGGLIWLQEDQIDPRLQQPLRCKAWGCTLTDETLGYPL